jgi:hypothetical protein
MEQFEVTVGISPEEHGPASETNPWRATVLDTQPVGLFAYGATFSEARTALADLMWAFFDVNSPTFDSVTRLELRVLTVKHYIRTKS